MYTYVDSLMLGGLEEGASLAMVHHLDDNTVSIMEVGDTELDYLGAENIGGYPLHTPVEVTDSEGWRHVIMILAKAA